MITLLVFLTFILNLKKVNSGIKKMLKLALVASMTSIFIISLAMYLESRIDVIEFFMTLLLSMFFIGIYQKKISQQVMVKYNTSSMYYKRSKKDRKKDNPGIRKSPWVPFNPLAGFLSLF